MDVATEGKAALIIVNWDYVGMEKLEYPENDGQMMSDILNSAEFEPVKVVKNSENILTDIALFVEEIDGKSLESFHFHFSGVINEGM